jgi:hypothetical protein
MIVQPTPLAAAMLLHGLDLELIGDRLRLPILQTDADFASFIVGK